MDTFLISIRVQRVCAWSSSFQEEEAAKKREEDERDKLKSDWLKRDCISTETASVYQVFVNNMQISQEIES